MFGVGCYQIEIIVKVLPALKNTKRNKIMNLQKFRIGLITVMLFILSINAYSAYTVTGCVSDDTGFLYTGFSGVTRTGGYGPAYEATPVVTTAQLGTGIYCSPTTIGNCVIRARADCRQCTGPYDYKDGKGEDMWYEQKGKLKGYMLCPIDDYIGFILVAMAGIGFVCIRKNLLFVS